MTFEFYETRAREYAAWTRELVEFPGLEHELLSFTSALRPGAVILDAGSGSGRDSRFFLARGFRVIMLDRSHPLLLEARSFVGSGGLSCSVVADLRELPLRDQAVDGVWASGSLLHLAREELRPAMLEVQRVLSSRGCFGLSMKLGEGEETRPDGRRFTYVSEAELRAYASSVGFRLIHRIGPCRKMWVTLILRVK